MSEGKAGYAIEVYNSEVHTAALKADVQHTHSGNSCRFYFEVPLQLAFESGLRVNSKNEIILPDITLYSADRARRQAKILQENNFDPIATLNGILKAAAEFTEEMERKNEARRARDAAVDTWNREWNPLFKKAETVEQVGIILENMRLKGATKPEGAYYAGHEMVEGLENELHKKRVEETRIQRLAALPWVRELNFIVSTKSLQEAEIRRFADKFQLQQDDIETVEISSEPWVRITATLPIKIGGADWQLKLSNRTYTSIGSEEDYCQEFPKFSDFSERIADALVAIFDGQHVEVRNYKKSLAYLNVETESDTIEVAVNEAD